MQKGHITQSITVAILAQGVWIVPILRCVRRDMLEEWQPVAKTKVTLCLTSSFVCSARVHLLGDCQRRAVPLHERIASARFVGKASDHEVVCSIGCRNLGIEPNRLFAQVIGGVLAFRWSALRVTVFQTNLMPHPRALQPRAATSTEKTYPGH